MLLAEASSFPNLYLDSQYYSWLAVRLTEAVCAVAGNSRLRQARTSLWTDWESIAQRKSPYSAADAQTGQLLKFLFGVLVPFANESAPKRIGLMTQRFQQATRPAAGPRPPAPPPEPLPETLQTLCRNGLKPADVRTLLIELGAIDAQTGRWHLGELTGKPGKFKRVVC